MKRLTIDLDKKSQLKKTLIKINDFFNKKAIDEIWVSASGRGYHLITYELDTAYDLLFMLRELFGDDKWRIKIDRYKRRYTKNGLDVLWTIKGSKKAKMIYNRFTGLNKLPLCYRKYVN